MPKEARTWPTSKSAANKEMILSKIFFSCSWDCSEVRTRTNSSPPHLARISFARIVRPRRCAASFKNASPAGWPNWSLILLKWSKSIKHTAKCIPASRELKRAWSSLRIKVLLFNTPVSSSKPSCGCACEFCKSKFNMAPCNGVAWLGLPKYVINFWVSETLTICCKFEMVILSCSAATSACLDRNSRLSSFELACCSFWSVDCSRPISTLAFSRRRLSSSLERWSLFASASINSCSSGEITPSSSML